MDANGLRFWSLADERDWPLPSSGTLRFDRERRTLKLSSFRELALDEPAGDPLDLLEVPPQAVDLFDTYAFCDTTRERVFAAGAVPRAQQIAEVVGRPISDLALGQDGILYLAAGGALTLVDPRQRWPEHTIERPELVAFRFAALAGGGVVILDRQNKALWRSEGQPFPQRGLRRFDGDVFRPDQENPDPPRVRPLVALEADEDPVAIASNGAGEVVLLFWLPDRSARIRRVELDGRLGPSIRLLGVQRPFSVGWLDRSTLAILVRTSVEGAEGPSARFEVVPYTFPEDGDLDALPLGGVYPLIHYTGGPFAHGVREPVRYPSRAPSPPAQPPEPVLTPDVPRPLLRLSKPELMREGAIELPPIDSGQLGTTWHRVYLEAVIPAECSVRVWLAATETSAAPVSALFFLHVFGDEQAPAGVPHGVWSSLPSELPFGRPLCPCPAEPHRAGLFTVLVQRAGRLVRSLSGRYLHVRVELAGNLRATPEVAALRCYGSRFSYVEQYLPRLYREHTFAPEADNESEQATPADFLERFLGNFEGILTPLEDRIANAHLLTDPESAPDEALDWLGCWVGFVFDPAYPAAQRRLALNNAAELHRWHGTFRGLTLALDILTAGALGRGEVVVVEDFRLRRTFATILGADLADEDDPLLGGIVDSGNSIVGDTLILGNEFQREFLSVFREVLPERPRGSSLEEWVSYIFQRFIDPHAVDQFFDGFAHRLTVLVQKEVSADQVRLIERVLELEAPAHLLSQVVRASQPFIVGLASLVGVDTFIRGPKPLPATHVDDSKLGTTFLLRGTSLDPRLEVGA